MKTPHNKPQTTTGSPRPIDDRLREVPEPPPRRAAAAAKGQVLGGFVLARIDALEKPKLDEELIDPGTSNPCGCNAVCTCVPVQSCACNEVCTCDTVQSCASYCACIGNCCVNVYWLPCV